MEDMQYHEVDGELFAEWYPEAKFYFDGSVYVAIPKHSNPYKRHKPKREPILVSKSEGGYKIEKPKRRAMDMLIEMTEDDPLFDTCPFTIEEMTKPAPKKKVADKPKIEKEEKLLITKEELFNQLYEKYGSLEMEWKRDMIYWDMKGLFKNDEAAKAFITVNMERAWRNLSSRLRRYDRKMYNNIFNYFVTFTYSDEKHTEESFKKALLETLRNNSSRSGWRYMGVWERGEDTNRLHFHALMYIPEGKMIGKVTQHTDYNVLTHRLETRMMNDHYLKVFGRNEFAKIQSEEFFNYAKNYVMKYIRKQNGNMIMSRGLKECFISDIYWEDIMCRLYDGVPHSQLVLAPDFTCWDEGCRIGTVSPEVLAQLRRSN